MADNVIRSNPGWVNGAQDGTWDKETALFMKLFTGEVITAFDEKNVMKDLHRTRTITHGKSASFAVTGKANGRYHTPGTPILGSNVILHGEKVINIDDLLIADVFLYDLDEAKNHYDVRAEYSKQLGAALAKAFDVRTMQVGLLAARSGATLTGGNGGSVIKNVAFATDGEALAAGMFAAAQTFDEKDVPDENRTMLVKPAQYYLLAQTTKVLNRDWGGQGVYAEGSVLKVAGVQIVKTNHLPTTNVSAVTGERNPYAGDFTNTVALVMNERAIGTVKLRDLAVQKTGADFNVQYQATLIVAKYAMGHGVLQPDCAIELSKAAV